MKIVRYLLLLVLFVTIGGCQKERGADDPIHFTVYGTVFDQYGEPVNGAKITLYYGTHASGIGSSKPSGVAGSSVSGLDGQFRIPCVATDNLISENRHMYQLEAVCKNHQGYSEGVTIMETEGAEIQMDILLK